MSANTYYDHPDGLAHVYKTTDANQRRRLLRQGWKKTNYQSLRSWYDRKALQRLAARPDGEYMYWRNDRAFSFYRNDV